MMTIYQNAKLNLNTSGGKSLVFNKDNDPKHTSKLMTTWQQK